MEPISIVIPAFNEQDSFPGCLDAITRQRPHSLRFEVVVVDDCSTDGTAAFLKSIQTSRPDFPLRIFRNDSNKGRFQSRLRGIKEAKFELILLLDSKVYLAENVFLKIAEINYQPLLGTHHQLIENNGFDKFYNLVRRKVYFKEFPKLPSTYVYVDDGNFDRLPKGTGDFLCTRELLLSSLPQNTTREGSDDTAWLREISKKSKIMVHNEFEVTYHPRQSLKQVVRHLYDRGPKFVDYYYRPSHLFFWILNLAVILMLYACYRLLPTTPWILVIGIILFFNAAAAIYLSRSFAEFALAFRMLPAVAVVFGAGVVKGLLLKLSFQERG